VTFEFLTVVTSGCMNVAVSDLPASSIFRVTGTRNLEAFLQKHCLFSTRLHGVEPYNILSTRTEYCVSSLPGFPLLSDMCEN